MVVAARAQNYRRLASPDRGKYVLVLVSEHTRLVHLVSTCGVFTVFSRLWTRGDMWRTVVGSWFSFLVQCFGLTLHDGFRVVAFLFLTRIFIFTKRFSVVHTRNHDHPQLGCITPTDGMVKDVS